MKQHRSRSQQLERRAIAHARETLRLETPEGKALDALPDGTRVVSAKGVTYTKVGKRSWEYPAASRGDSIFESWCPPLDSKIVLRRVLEVA